MTVEDYYLKACKVLESCENLDQFKTAFNYVKLLIKKFPTEDAFTKLIDLSIQQLNNLENYERK